MDIYRTTGIDPARDVDLDDLATYPAEWKGKNVERLHQFCYEKIGYVFMYFNHFRTGIDYGDQPQTFAAMCHHLSEEWRNHIKDTSANRLWYLKWIYKFEDEFENLC